MERRNRWSISVLLVLGLCCYANAQTNTFSPGDVFVTTATTTDPAPTGVVEWFRPDGTRRPDIPVQGWPEDVGFDSLGNMYVLVLPHAEFVQNGDIQTVQKFDNAGRLVDPNFLTFPVPQFPHAGGFRIDSHDNLFIIFDVPPGIEEYSLATRTLIGTFPIQSSFLDVSADEKTIWHLGLLPCCPDLYKLDIATQTATDLGPLPSTDSEYLRIMPDGNILVANGNFWRYSGGVAASIVGPAGGPPLRSYYIPSPTGHTDRLALDPDGTSFWALDAIAPMVFKVDIASGKTLTSFGVGTTPPWKFGFAVFPQTIPPQITSISPTSGNQGQTVSNFIVNGNNFQPGATLSFSGDAGVHVNSSVVTGTQIIANISVSIVAAAGPRDVTVTNPDGQKAVLSGAFTVVLATPPPQPAISVSPTALTFGTVAPQGSKSLLLTVTNPGTAPLLIYGAGSLGNVSSASAFTVSNPIPTPINPKSSATITVTFSPLPNTIGTISSVLGITTNAPTGNTYVTMTGTVASINKPLLLLPIEWPLVCSPLVCPPLDIQPINTSQVANKIVTDFTIRNLTGTWYEVTLDPNDPNGPPHPKAPNWLNPLPTAQQIPNSFLIAPRQVLKFPQDGTHLVFSSGQYLQFRATDQSLNASVAFAVDMAIRGLFGTSLVPNPSTTILTQLVGLVEDVKVQTLSCGLNLQQTMLDAIANQSKSTPLWDTMASDDAALIGCIAGNQVLVSDVENLLQIFASSNAASQWVTVAKDLNAATTAFSFVNNFWAYMVPLGYAQLTGNSSGYVLLQVPLPGR